jgi:hypothetical protein
MGDSLPLEQEEEGLRAFEVSVGAYAGAAYPERPEWIEIAGKRIEVEALESSWREEERIGFRVRLAGGARMLLYYVPELDLWSGVKIDRAPGDIIPRRSS